MPKFYGQNKKRIDPRYFLNETADRDNDVSIGMMVKTLLDAGVDDIFDSPQGVDPKSLRNLIGTAEMGAGGIESWEPDVFSDDYNVDLDRVVRLYARRMNPSAKEGEEMGERSDLEQLLSLLHHLEMKVSNKIPKS